MASTTTISEQPGPRDHLPPHLRGDVTLPGPGGTSGLVGVADLVAFGAMADPDPAATAAWTDTADPAGRPSAAAIAGWLPLAEGDEYAALLCATVDAAAARASEATNRLDREPGNTAANLIADITARRVHDEARADVAQYFGETLADQHPAVRRAAGCLS